MLSNGEIGFAVGSYDETMPLTIDPIVEFASFFGGEEETRIVDARFDAAGFVYRAGFSRSTWAINTSPAILVAEKIRLAWNCS